MNLLQLRKFPFIFRVVICLVGITIFFIIYLSTSLTADMSLFSFFSSVLFRTASSSSNSQNLLLSASALSAQLERVSTLQDAIDMISSKTYPRFQRVFEDDDNVTNLCRFFRYKIVPGEATRTKGNEEDYKKGDDEEEAEDQEQVPFFSRPLVKIGAKRMTDAKYFRYELQDEETMTPRVSPADVEVDDDLHERAETTESETTLIMKQIVNNKNQKIIKNHKKKTRLSWTYFRPSSHQKKNQLRRKHMALLDAGEMRRMETVSAHRRMWFDANTISSSSSSSVKGNSPSTSSSEVDVFVATWQTPLDEDIVGISKTKNGTFFTKHSSPATSVLRTLARVFNESSIAAVRVDSYNPRMFVPNPSPEHLNTPAFYYMLEAVARLASVQFFKRTGITYDFFIRSRFDLIPLETIRVGWWVRPKCGDKENEQQRERRNADEEAHHRPWFIQVGGKIKSQDPTTLFCKNVTSSLPASSSTQRSDTLFSSSDFDQNQRDELGRFKLVSNLIDLVSHHRSRCCTNDWIAIGRFSSLLKTHSFYSLQSLTRMKAIIERRKEMLKRVDAIKTVTRTRHNALKLPVSTSSQRLHRTHYFIIGGLTLKNKIENSTRRSTRHRPKHQ